jgi:Rieske 2Fe-2S family protein
MELGLPARYFTSRSVHEQESDRIFRNGWLCLDRVDRLSAVGEYRTYEIEGVSILATRTDQGLQTFHNVCRHRGAILCTEPCGELNNGRIQCAYHAWTYGGAGELLSAPNMRNDPDFKSHEFGLAPIASAEWNGYLMINLAVEPEPFAAAYDAVMDQFRPWSMDQLTMKDQRIYNVQANWKLVFQNFSECYHCPTVHPALAKLTPYQSATNDIDSGPFQGGPMQLSDGTDTMSSDGKSVSRPLPRLSSKQRRTVGYYTLFPTMFISPHPDYVMVHRLYRQTIDRTRIECDFLFDQAAIESGEADPARAVEFWDMTNRQDWHVCELVQRGAASHLPPGPYSPLETVLPKFDRHYLAQMDSPQLG